MSSRLFLKAFRSSTTPPHSRVSDPLGTESLSLCVRRCWVSHTLLTFSEDKPEAEQIQPDQPLAQALLFPVRNQNTTAKTWPETMFRAFFLSLMMLLRFWLYWQLSKCPNGCFFEALESNSFCYDVSVSVKSKTERKEKEKPEKWLLVIN